MKQETQKQFGNLTLMELCDLYPEITDRVLKLQVHRLIASQ